MEVWDRNIYLLKTHWSKILVSTKNIQKESRLDVNVISYNPFFQLTEDLQSGPNSHRVRPRVVQELRRENDFAQHHTLNTVVKIVLDL